MAESTDFLPMSTRVMTMQASGKGNVKGTVWNRVGFQVSIRDHGQEETEVTVHHVYLMEIPRPMTRACWAAMPERDQREYIERHRIKIRHSTGICEEETAGWGAFDADHGYFEFPCEWALKEREAP